MSAWANSVSASLQAHYGFSNIGQGVIFYNSSDATYNDNSQTKIRLDFVIRGIKGLWKKD